jgi:hypothetical protein
VIGYEPETTLSDCDGAIKKGLTTAIARNVQSSDVYPAGMNTHKSCYPHLMGVTSSKSGVKNQAKRLLLDNSEHLVEELTTDCAFIEACSISSHLRDHQVRLTNAKLTARGELAMVSHLDLHVWTHLFSRCDILTCFTYLLTRLLTYLLTYLLAYLLTYLLTHSCICSAGATDRLGRPLRSVVTNARTARSSGTWPP